MANNEPVHHVSHSSQPYVTLDCTRTEHYVWDRGGLPEGVHSAQGDQDSDVLYTFSPELVTCPACKTALEPNKRRVLPRVIVAGSRTCYTKQHRELVEHELERAVIMFESPIVVIHGACLTGADRFADDWARRRGYRIEAYPADFNGQGKSAGPRRNAAVARLGGDLGIILWDGHSPGTHNMVTCLVRNQIPLWITPVEAPLPRFPLWHEEGKAVPL